VLASSKNLVLGFLILIVACIYPPFSLAYKLFLSGLTLSIIRGGLHGRSVSSLDTIAGVMMLIGVIMGLYGFFIN
jgi:hypothetical protein